MPGSPRPTLEEPKGPEPPAFLAGGGEMGERIRRHDWAATPLGPVETWPQALRAALGICLHSSFPTAIYWGPELRLLYNDAWAPIPAERHPWALGRPAREVWADIWEVVAPQFAQVLEQGQGLSTYDRMLPMVRGGRAEETYWNYSFTPIRGEDGSVVGVFNQGNETTARVLAERRQAFLLGLSDRLRSLSDPHAIIASAQEAVGRHLCASRVGYGEVDSTARYFTTSGNWTDGTVEPRHGTHDLAAFGPEILEALRKGETLVVHDVATDPRTSAPERRAAFAAIETASVVTATLVKDGRLRAALYVHIRSPRSWRDGEVELVEEVAERTWAAVERAHAELALRESEARFRNMADSAPLMMWVTEPGGRCIYLNRGWYEFTGQAEEEALGFGWLDAVHPEDRGWSGETFLKADARREPFRLEYRLRRADGTYRWAIDAAAPRFGAGGEFLGYIGSVIDIDERHEAEQRLRDLANAIPAFVWFATPDGGLQYLNRRWYEYTGQTPKQALPHGWAEALHPEDAERTAAVWADARRRGVTYEIKMRYRRRDGEYRWYVARAEPVRDAAGRIVAWFGSSTDIHDRRMAENELRRLNESLEHRVAEAVAERAKAEEALRQAQKLEAIGQLTGGVAHDFNNLLTVIRSSADLLRREDLPAERRRRYLDAIRDTVDRAARVTGQLLAFARRQALQPLLFDAAERVRSVADMLRTVLGSRIRIIIDADEPCAVEADPGQFEAAIINMAVNARDAMEGGGSLTVRVREVAEMPAIRGHAGGAGAFVAISLTDTGCGIPEDRLALIFEPFFTTKQVGKGTGLGLSQVYGFAKQSGGDVAVESEVGRGTTFTLYLPRAGDSPAAAPEATAPEQGLAESGRGLRVLLVEDNSEVGAFSSQILQDLGYQTVWATNAEEALTRLAENGTAFDIVFSDVVMPGMSGVELGKEIRRRHPGLPVLLTSGYSHVLAEERGHGFELLHKPYAAAELSEALRRIAWRRKASG